MQFCAKTTEIVLLQTNFACTTDASFEVNARLTWSVLRLVVLVIFAFKKNVLLVVTKIQIAQWIWFALNSNAKILATSVQLVVQMRCVFHLITKPSAYAHQIILEILKLSAYNYHHVLKAKNVPLVTSASLENVLQSRDVCLTLNADPQKSVKTEDVAKDVEVMLIATSKWRVLTNCVKIPV